MIRRFSQSIKLHGTIAVLLAVVGIALFVTAGTSAACTTPTNDYGTATISVTVPTTGQYRVWSRIKAPDSTNNSFSMEVDSGACITVGDATLPANTWTWVDYQNGASSSKVNLSLTAGTHNVKMLGREAGVAVDRVILTGDMNCIPTGTGNNCSTSTDTTAPTVSLTSPVAGATVKDIVTLTANATDASGVTKVDFLVDGQVVGTSNAAPYSHSVDTKTLANGQHTLSARAYDTANNTATSTSVVVNVNNQTAGQADLVITEIQTSPVALLEGQATLFKAVVKNQGTAATTMGVNHGVRFDVNGEVVSWSGANTDVSIAPGGSYTFSANNGPSGSQEWEPAAGTYTVHAQVDDLALIGESDDSNNTQSRDVTVNKPTDTQAPSVPGGLEAVAASATQINLKWQTATDNVGVTGYWVIRNGVAVAQLTTTSYTDRNLQPATKYTYEVTAVDMAGNTSARSTAVSATTPALADTAAPSMPAGLVAQAVSSTQINLSWTASTDNIGVVGYDIYRSVGTGAASKVATVTSTSYGNTGLTPATTYQYYVIARDAAGNSSGASAKVSATTLATATRGSVSGVISGDRGPIVGAKVQLRVGRNRIIVYTNIYGRYNISNLSPGSYTISASARNYLSKQTSLTITAGSTTLKDIVLVRK